jgi:hypothetical protein
LIAVVTWGGGWAVASVLLPFAAHLADVSSPPSVVAAALLVGAPLLGAPVYVTARGTGARRPGVEAIVWVVLLAVTVAVVVGATMSFGPVNAVTTEDIRRGQQGGTSPYPPELVWGLGGGVAFCALAGLGSMVLNAATSDPFGIAWRAVVFSAAVASSLALAALLFALGGPLVWRLAAVYRVGYSAVWRLIPVELVGVAVPAFLSGCVAGVVIHSVRHALRNTSPAPPPLDA